MPARIKVSPGDRYGRMIVVSEAAPRGRFRYMWCRCDCGAEKLVMLWNLRSGHTESCGCARFKLPEIGPGDRYGRLTVVREVLGVRHREMVCRCDCGVEKVIALRALRDGSTKSCGCLRREIANSPEHQEMVAAYVRSPEHRALISKMSRSPEHQAHLARLNSIPRWGSKNEPKTITDYEVCRTHIGENGKPLSFHDHRRNRACVPGVEISVPDL